MVLCGDGSPVLQLLKTRHHALAAKPSATGNAGHARDSIHAFFAARNRCAGRFEHGTRSRKVDAFEHIVDHGITNS